MKIAMALAAPEGWDGTAVVGPVEGFRGVVAGDEAAGDLSRNPAWMARKF
jgi:hypothetical protein